MMADAQEPVRDGMATCLYRHFDGAGVLLYVGVSLNVVQRLSQHREHSEWHGSIARVDVEWFSSRAEALAAERTAVEKENPLHNKRLRPKPPRLAAPGSRAEETRHQLMHRVVNVNPVYSLTGAAELLGISSGAVLAKIRSGDLGAIVVGTVVQHGKTHQKYQITGWQIIDYLEALEARTKVAA